MPVLAEQNPYLVLDEEPNPYLVKDEDEPNPYLVLDREPVKHEPPQVYAPSKYTGYETPAPGTPQWGTDLGLQETTTKRGAPEAKMVEQTMERRHEEGLKRFFPEKGGPTDPDFEEARNWIKAAKNAGIDMTTEEGVVEFSNFIGNLGIGIVRQPEGVIQMVKQAQQDPVAFAKETGIWLAKGIQYIGAHVPGAHLKKGTAETRAELTEAVRAAPVETAMQVTWPLAAAKGAYKLGAKIKGRVPMSDLVPPETQAKMKEVSRAEKVRETEGQLQEARDVGQKGKGKGGEDIQRAEEIRPETRQWETQWEGVPKEEIVPTESAADIATAAKQKEMAGKQAGSPAEKAVKAKAAEMAERQKTASYELGFMGTPEAARLLGESVVAGARRVASVASDVVKSVKVPEGVKAGVESAKEAMAEHHTKIREPELLTYLFEHEFKKAVPDKARQELILHSLQQRRQHKGYTELTPQEQGVLKWVEIEADRLAKYVKDNEIIAEGITDQFSEKGNRYLFQWWRDPTGKARKSKYGKFAKTAPQFKQRTHATYEAGIEAGLEPVTTNVGRIIGETWQAVVRAHESQQMHNSMAKINVLDANMQMKRSKGGQPKPARFIEKWADLEEAGLADEYVREVDHFWGKATTYIPAEGAKPAQISRTPIGIHKQLYPFWKAYKDSPSYGKFAKFVFTTKSMKLFSFFHPVQLGVNQAATGRVPFTGIIKGKKLWTEGNETIRLLHKHGLEMPGRYEDINYGDLFKFKGETLAGKVGNVLLKPVEWNAKLIFNQIQPGMKTVFAYGKFNKLWPKYQRKGLSIDVCARDVVKAADQFFSGEDYKRAMLETNKYMARYYFSAGARKGWQMSLISPTWQRENIILVKNVLKSMVPEPLVEKMGLQKLGPSASIYRRYLGAAIGLYGAANLYNWMATKEMDGKGEMMWQNPKPFGVRMLWNSPEYTTTDKNGKERKHPGGKPVYWRPFKTIVEVPEFFFGEQDRDKGALSNVATSMVKKTGYKVAPWLAATAKLFFGYQYSSPSAAKRVKDWAVNVFAPISAMQASDWVEGKKNPQDALGAFFGMPSGTISATEFKRIFYERWGYALIAKDEDEMKRVVEQWNELPNMGKFNRTKAIDIKNEILKEQEEEL
jgi:hypothetical protein